MLPFSPWHRAGELRPALMQQLSFCIHHSHAPKLMALSRDVQEKWEWRKKGKESLRPLVRLNSTTASLGRETPRPPEAPQKSLHKASRSVVLTLSARVWLLHFSTTEIWMYPLVWHLCTHISSKHYSPSCHFPGYVFTDLQIHTLTLSFRNPKLCSTLHVMEFSTVEDKAIWSTPTLTSPVPFSRALGTSSPNAQIHEIVPHTWHLPNSSWRVIWVTFKTPSDSSMLYKVETDRFISIIFTDFRG